MTPPHRAQGWASVTLQLIAQELIDVGISKEQGLRTPGCESEERIQKVERANPKMHTRKTLPVENKRRHVAKRRKMYEHNFKQGL